MLRFLEGEGGLAGPYLSCEGPPPSQQHRLPGHHTASSLSTEVTPISPLSAPWQGWNSPEKSWWKIKCCFLASARALGSLGKRARPPPAPSSLQSRRMNELVHAGRLPAGGGRILTFSSLPGPCSGQALKAGPVAGGVWAPHQAHARGLGRAILPAIASQTLCFLRIPSQSITHDSLQLRL